MKWYNKLAIFLCVVVFSPIILAAVLFAGAMYLFKLPKNKKEYRPIFQRDLPPYLVLFRSIHYVTV